MAAAVTEVTERTVNVEGALTAVYQTVTLASNGDWWIPGLTTVLACGSNTPAEITKLAPSTDNPSKIVLTSGGAVVAAQVWAIGYP